MEAKLMQSRAVEKPEMDLRDIVYHTLKESEDFAISQKKRFSMAVERGIHINALAHRVKAPLTDIEDAIASLLPEGKIIQTRISKYG
eukprot:4764749-Pyramimonas_sp.AAC.1